MSDSEKAIDELVAIGERAFGDAPPSEPIAWRGPALPKSVTRGTALQPGDKLNARGEISIGEASLVSRLIVLAYQFGEAAARQEVSSEHQTEDK